MVKIFENDLSLVLGAVYLINSVLILTVLGVLYNKKVLTVGKRVISVVGELAVLSLFWAVLIFYNGWVGEFVGFGNLVRLDSLSLYLIIFVLGAFIMSLLISLEYFRKDTIDDFEYVLLQMLSVIGLLVLLTANDLLVVYLGVELQSLCLYILASYKQNSVYSTEAGLKYFVIGAFSSGILLFGMSLVYGFTGVTGFDDLRLLFSSGFSEGAYVGLIFILVGLLFKVGAVPFHVWLPDVYSGSPLVSTSYFAIIPKIGIFGLLLKLIFLVFGSIHENLEVILFYSGLLSIMVGSLGAIYQRTLKRLVAYSAIGHTGFMLLAFGSGNYVGIEAVLLYILIYVLMSLNLFGVVINVRKQSNFENLRVLGSYSEVYRGNKVLGISLCLILFSMAGVPPLAGFYSKLWVFNSLIKEGNYLISILGILLSVVGSVYYLRLIKIMYFGVNRTWGYYFPVSRESSYVIVWSLLLVVLFGVYSDVVFMGLENLGLSLEV